MTSLGTRVYGMAALMMGVIGLVSGDFASVWQPVPQNLPDRLLLAWLVGATLATSGAALQWRRTAFSGAATLTILYAMGVVLLHLPRAVPTPLVLAGWAGVAEQTALVAGGMIALSMSLDRRPKMSATLRRAGLIAFGLCCLVFGAVHFRYELDTAQMVPKYMPLGQLFWARATGAAQIGAGLAILTGIRARFCAELLTLMYVSFSLLVHIPYLLSDPHSHMYWVMNAMNLSLTGSAWVVADSLGKQTSRAAAAGSMMSLLPLRSRRTGLRAREQRQQRLEAIVTAAVKAVRQQFRGSAPSILSDTFFGAMGIDPKHLAIWYIFKMDADLEKARETGLTDQIEKATRSQLLAGGYPAKAVPLIGVAFTSDEDVQIKAGGNYWQYFK